VKNIAADGQGYEIHSDEGVQRKYWATLTSSVKVGGEADTEIVQGSDRVKTD